MIKLRFRKKTLVILLSILVLLGLFKGMLHFINSPVEGTVAVQRSTNPVVNTGNNDFVSLGNKYFTLLYPNFLTFDLPEHKTTSNLSYDYLTSRDSANNVLTSLEIYVKPLPHGGVTLDEDYKKYQSEPKLYKFSRKYHTGELVDVATRNSGSIERNALWVHGDYLLVVKLKSSEKDDMDTNLATILNSVQWQKN